jgi:hypothetical protein
VATAPELSGVSGKYFADSNEERPNRFGRDDALAERLWDFTLGAVKDYI